MGILEVTIFFVEEDGVTPVPVFWSEKTFFQTLSKLFPLQYREKFANTAFVKVNMPEDITFRGMLNDLRERGVISEGESVHSQVLVEIGID